MFLPFLVVSDEDEAAAHDDQAKDEGEVAEGMQHQFLRAEDRPRAGDTQALAPATEDQAVGMEDKVDLHAEEAARQEDQEEDGDAAAAAAAEQDAEMQDAEEGDGDDGEGRSNQPTPGAAPRKWGGGNKSTSRPSHKDSAEGPPEASMQTDGMTEEERRQAEEERRRQELLASLDRREENNDGLQSDPLAADPPDGGIPENNEADLISGSVARLALDVQQQVSHS